MGGKKKKKKWRRKGAVQIDVSDRESAASALRQCGGVGRGPPTLGVYIALGVGLRGAKPPRGGPGLEPVPARIMGYAL